MWEVLNSTTYYGDYVYNRTDSRSGEKRDESEHIVTRIPAIIDRSTFDRAAEIRAQKAPGKSTEYRAAASPTLLTGLAKCARCGAGFVLVSGKGGHYDYYRCGTRQYKGNSMCDAPNIPREELDALVLDLVAEKVIAPERIESMLSELRIAINEMQTPDKLRAKELERKVALAREQINSWYEMIESGKLEFHATLRDRLDATQRRIDAMDRELGEITRRRQVPLKKFGQSQIVEFASGIKQELLSSDSKLAKTYLQTIVTEIRIGGGEGELLGSNANMAGAISGWSKKTGHMSVPSHVSNWRARQDSNSYM
ncbi:MAG: recombinase zinc beta ribbon domain-containing protein [Abyssibacter sp.]|nr:recombinase zinc beta ribbon domain-containing protein [Abyssibacter sp.]